ncbi:MAG: hypothetical protein M1484_00235 [Patescibacteria group bacterium]|nr:hypothetical protein [Patescibacteria group bacterium]MCL5431509.1 hypothetical protein [Patescibacteria group bacterium]
MPNESGGSEFPVDIETIAPAVEILPPPISERFENLRKVYTDYQNREVDPTITFDPDRKEESKRANEFAQQLRVNGGVFREALEHPDLQRKTLTMMWTLADDSLVPVRDEIQSIVAENGDVLENLLATSTDTVVQARCLDVILEGCDENHWQSAVDMVYRHWNVVEGFLRSPAGYIKDPDPMVYLHKPNEAISVINQIVSIEDNLYNNNDTQENPVNGKAASTLRNFLVNGVKEGGLKLTEAAGYLGNMKHASYAGSVRTLIAETAGELLRDKGIKEGLEMAEGWLETDRAKISENFRQIEELENQKPGICSFLHDKFGVSHFYRYPTEMLVKQFQEYEKNDKPYGVIMAAKADWNGAFYQGEHSLESMLKGLEGHYYLRVYECDSPYELTKNLIKSDKKYGEQHKISFLVAMGHGTSDAITLGEAFNSGRITQEQVGGPTANSAKKFFVDHPTFLLDSCSTGAEGGFAQTLSRNLNARVRAPIIPAGLNDVIVTLDEDGVDLIPVLSDQSPLMFIGREPESVSKLLGAYNKGEKQDIKEVLKT